jgi:CubicO group peptidase (beta-lactamase class C family)
MDPRYTFEGVCTRFRDGGRSRYGTSHHPRFPMYVSSFLPLSYRRQADDSAHRTGLPPHNFAITDDGTPEKDMAKLAFSRPNTPFRANFTYSNLNYAAITYVVELLTHQTYSQVLDELIFKPLGMNAYSNFTKLVEEGGEYSQGWSREGVNYTQCGIDATIAVGKNDTSLEGLFPTSCAGDLNPIDFWTKTAGHEFGGGGNIIATGNDLVSFLPI